MAASPLAQAPKQGGRGALLPVGSGCSPESCWCSSGWGSIPPLLPAALLRAPSFSLQSFPAGQLRTWGRVTDPGRRRGGRDHPLSVLLLLLELCWSRSRRCGSPELVAQQPESINMLCRKCRGSPSCCQRAGRRLRVTQDPTPA